MLGQKFLGARLYQCSGCQLQYYDRRGPAVNAATDTANSAC